MTTATPAQTVPAGRTVYLETFGCQMNVLDSQLVRSQLAALGFSFTDDYQSADVVLYNTCSVREHAESKVYSRLGLVGQLKKERPGVVLGVLGCMAERDGIDLLRRYPQVDLLCGPGELDKVPLLIDNVSKTAGAYSGGHAGAYSGGRLPRRERAALQGSSTRRSATLAAAEDQLELLDLSRSFSPDEHRGSAYVRITRGCNKFCTYCVVPYTRGPEVHRPPDHLVEECRKLASAGVVEITLLGQTVNHYHYDEKAAVTVDGIRQPQVGAVVGKEGVRGKGQGTQNEGAPAGPSPLVSSPSAFVTFAMLLRRIHDEVPELQRLRFVTNFPRDFGSDILEAIRDCPRICRFLHLPVQSGSNRILKMMNRGHTVEDYRDLIERVRAILPQAQLATDIICGFPTETEEDHQATLDLLRWGRFKNSFIFKYSPRPGTTAYDKLPDDVPEAIKRRRNNELLAAQSEISAQVHRQLIGRRVSVFVESVSEHAAKREGAVDLGWEKPRSVTQLSGRTDGDLIVCFEGDPGLVGRIVEVDIERAATLALFGRRVG